MNKTEIECSGVFFEFSHLRGVFLFFSKTYVGFSLSFLTYVGCGEAGEDVQMSHRDWVIRR